MEAAKTVVIHQPDFMPYLGFFHRLLFCDLFIVLDHVQFSKGGWHNRDKIKASNGTKWITIPVRLKGLSYSAINEVMINNDLDWRREHLRLFELHYCKAEYFTEIYSDLSSVYGNSSHTLMGFNLLVMEWILKLFDIRVPLIYSSSLSPEGRSNEMLANLLRKVEADYYLSGVGARNYFKDEPFKRAGIRVVWQDFKHPVYPQLYGEFVPYLSCIDLLFNCGVRKSSEILRGCQ